MSDDGVSYWALLIPAFLGLLLARQVMKLRYLVIKDRDVQSAFTLIESEYSEPFVPMTMEVGPSRDERIRCGYRALLFAAFVPPFFLCWYSSSHNGFSFFSFVIGVTALAGSIQQLWRYFRWQDEAGGVESVELRLDHLIVVTAYGERHVYVYDGTMQVLVSCEQDFVGVWPLRVHHRTEVMVSIKDQTDMSTFPFRGKGCGPFLALCRQSGAKVDVLAETAVQKKFALFASGVDPNWIAQPAKPRPHRRGTIKDMVCSGCGAKSSFDAGATLRACEYCGSSDLTPA